MTNTDPRPQPPRGNPGHWLRVDQRHPDMVFGDTECGRQIWTKTARAVRKQHTCIICGLVVEKGKAQMYRPMTNQSNRYSRACALCVEQGPPKPELLDHFTSGGYASIQP